MPLIVETDALEFLAKTLREGGLGGEVGLRLLADGARFELVPDRPRPHDRVFEVEGDPVLLVDPEVDRRVLERRLECEQGAVKLGWQE